LTPAPEDGARPAPRPQQPTTVREDALAVLRERDPARKAALARALRDSGPFGETQALEEPDGIPGRPPLPRLVPPAELKPRPTHTIEGRAALIHALAHIELNAIDLAADLVWRFAGLPAAFYAQWATVAREEALHFQLLREHLRTLGRDYGDFPAHNALWEMAQRTRHDLLARLALVPRTLEARGLDASPPIKARLVAAGDHRAGEILDVILRDEIGHVAIGNNWYRWACERDALDPEAHAQVLARQYRAPPPRGPFNLEARRRAGFTEAELQRLVSP
jgi:uncharacterized ferritin-like protein (DUF455 family)